MFFSRGDYDANHLHEAQTRLQTFQGATSISSNQYFGREEEGLARDDPITQANSSDTIVAEHERT